MSDDATGESAGSEGRVLGIGGLFVRPADPAQLASWYRTHLGFVATEAG